MKISYMILDDEPLAHEIIETYCEDLSFMERKANCYNAIQAMTFLDEHSVDLIFLDINMPKMKGFDFLKTLNDPPHIIVTSAYSEYAVEGFELNVSDYLLKPYSFERFIKALNKVKSSLLKGSESDEQKKDDTIFIRGRNGHHQLNVTDIQYVEARGNYTALILKHTEIISLEKISDLEKILEKFTFIRVHKSFLVSGKHIKEVQAGKICLENVEIPIGRVYKLNVQRFMENI